MLVPFSHTKELIDPLHETSAPQSLVRYHTEPTAWPNEIPKT